MKFQRGETVHVVQPFEGQLTILTAEIDHCRTFLDGRTEYHLLNWVGYWSESQLHATFENAMALIKP